MIPQQQVEPGRREHERRRVVKGGKIVFNNGQSVIDCSIRDMSVSGARIHIPDLNIMPHEFQLHLFDGRVMSCQLRWARKGMFGVRFLGA